MNCQNPRCNQALPTGSIFCSYCGTRLNSDSLSKDSQNYTVSDVSMNLSKRINPHLFSGGLWGGVLIIFIGYIAAVNKNGAIGVLLVFTGVGLTAFAYIYNLICIHRCWSILQGFTRRTTPDKAVGFLFIPFFNIYWTYIAYYGLSKDVNKFLNNKNISTNKINQSLSLARSILFVVPYLNFIVNPILDSILVYQYANFYNFAADNWSILSEGQDRSAIKKQSPALVIGLCASFVGIFIIGILAAIAIPQFSKYKTRSYVAALRSDLKKGHVAVLSRLVDYPNDVVDTVDKLNYSPGNEIRFEAVHMSLSEGYLCLSHSKLTEDNSTPITIENQRMASGTGCVDANGNIFVPQPK